MSCGIWLFAMYQNIVCDSYLQTHVFAVTMTQIISLILGWSDDIIMIYLLCVMYEIKIDIAKYVVRSCLKSDRWQRWACLHSSRTHFLLPCLIPRLWLVQNPRNSASLVSMTPWDGCSHWLSLHSIRITPLRYSVCSLPIKFKTSSSYFY